MRRLGLLLWAAGAAIGIAAEWLYFDGNDASHWLPDLAVGWSLIACGLLAWSRRRSSRAGLLMAAAGLAWFAHNFSTTGFGPSDWLAAHALYLYRGPLVHLLVCYPRGRVLGRLDRATVIVGYAAAVVTPVWQNELAATTLAAAIVLVVGRNYRHAVGRERRARLVALRATGALALALAGGAAVRFADPAGGTRDAILLSTEAVLGAVAFGLLAGLVRGSWDTAIVTDLVVEIGEARAGTVRDALARGLGDPTLEVGYWSPEIATYIESTGRPLALPGPGSHRRVTRIERDGEAVAALVHDPAVLDDPELVEAVGAATRLAASNAQLQAEVHARVAELQSSRRRLVQAGDEQRRRLEHRLREGAERRLAALTQVLERARCRAGTSEQTVEWVARAEDQLARTLAELRELARGLHPRALGERGLAGAIASLAESSPVRVELAVPEGRLPKDIEAAAYFLCSEALANVVKYASASRVVVAVTATRSLVRIEVADDGVGGADLAAGTGLRGLADRIEALGGTLLVASPRGSGTRLVAHIPLGDERM